MEKLIINLAPTGMIPTKKLSPYVPITPEEIIKDVKRCYPLGVSMVHIHGRDENGNSTFRSEVFREIIEGIKRIDKDLIICVSTSGRTFKEFEERSQVLNLKGKAKPDMASLTLSSLNFNKIASINSPEMIQRLAEKMLNSGIKPELEAFDIGMINYSKYLIKKKLIEPPFYFNLLLGNIACAQATPLNLGVMLSELPNGSIWSAAGVGDFQLKMNSMGIICGGGIRIGLEDNIWYDRNRTKLATNYDLVKRAVDIANSYEREVAKPKEVRDIIGL